MAVIGMWVKLDSPGIMYVPTLNIFLKTQIQFYWKATNLKLEMEF